ncbi:MAG: signal recognition particle-docking protein FtsY [Tenericutes bacterium]|nr:signal recognition particle-docking protein FtsY [Mycoplasmatota bacterium]
MGLFNKIKTIFSKKELELYDKGFEKTRDNFVSSLNNLSNKYKTPNDLYFDELEEILISADIGVNTVLGFMDRIKNRVKKENIDDLEELQEIIVDELFIIYVEDDVLTNKLNVNDNGPTVLLFIGVNGVGKTTTIAKVANLLKKGNSKVLLVAGDTFRAGAIEQLIEWGKRVSCEVVSMEESSDPSAVIYKGIDKAIKEQYDYVLIDTAGRLQNKVNLMNELEKMNKVIGKLIPNAPQETLLVIDATTGQNAINQVKSFKEITNVTGIVLTKLDGTAKGGIVLAIKEELKVPVKYIGLGEGLEDLKPFDIEKYIYGLFKGMIKDE